MARDIRDHPKKEVLILILRAIFSKINGSVTNLTFFLTFDNRNDSICPSLVN